MSSWSALPSRRRRLVSIFFILWVWSGILVFSLIRAYGDEAVYVESVDQFGQPVVVETTVVDGGVVASSTPGPGPVVETPPRVRNVILMIGDGMGPQEVGLLTLYARYAPHSTYADRVAAIERLYNAGVVGLVRPEPNGMLVVDSAAAATQLASGQLAGSEMIGVDFQGNPTKTVVEVARQLGKSTGLVTDTRVTHATPAGFAAHQPHRSMENEIAVDELSDRVDVMLGGGLRHWIPKSANDSSSTAYAAVLQMTGGQFPFSSKRTDERNLLVEARSDYQLAFDRHSLDRITGGRVLGLFADSEMDDALLERSKLPSGASRTQPTLVEMTTKTLELLDKNPNGFFVMIEGGQIDWAGHNNDAGTMLHELLRFDAAIDVAMKWAEKRGDTLVLVTADHETGGFGFSYAGRPLPAAAQLAGESFAGRAYQPNFNYAPVELLDNLYAQDKSFFTMTTEFDALPAKEQTAERLMEIVNSSSAYKITLDDAIEVLTRARNRNYAEKHPYLATKTVPRIRDFEAFYVYGENLRMNLLGRKLADEQHIVWGSGTHTSTPVVVGAYGPHAAAAQFNGMMHSTDLARRMIELLGGAGPSANTQALDTARKP